jgi:hypothetical protein
MSRRGNCWSYPVDESFFRSLKKERIRKRIHTTRDWARSNQIFLAVIGDPRHDEREHLLRWVGSTFSPEDFDINSANERILAILE